MNKMLLKSSLIASSAIGLVASVPAMAQDNSDIIVTARRTEERLQDVPISMTVFSQEQLANQNVTNAGDLAKYTPSLATNSRFGPENTSYAIRGFVQEGPTSPSVAVYFADVVAPRAQGGTTGGNGAGPGAYFDLQNVQVLKGPQGTLFGRNTTGGAVLLVPQKPTSRVEGYVEGSLGNYDMRRVQAVLNAPISDTLRIRLGVDRQYRKGYMHNVSNIGPSNFHDVDYAAFRLSVVADLTPNLENYLVASYTLSDTNGFFPKMLTRDNAVRDGFAAQRIAQLAATTGAYDISNGISNAGQKIEQWQVINTTTWAATDNITIKNIMSYSQIREDQTAAIYGENPYQETPGYTAANYGFTAISIHSLPGSHNIAQQTFTDELQLQGTAGEGALTYQAGLYYEKSTPIGGFQSTYSPNNLACDLVETLQCHNAVSPTRGPITGFIQNSRSKYTFRNLGAYAQATLKIVEGLNLTGGIRYTSDKTDGVGQVLKISFPTPNVPVYGCSVPANSSTGVVGGTSAQIEADPSRCNYVRSQKSKKPTWLINLDYKPVEDVMLYGKYARGYRQGGVNISSYGLSTWLPEKVDTYEIGAKTSWRGAFSGFFNIAAFYNDFSNQQIAINTVSCANIPSAPSCAGVPAIDYPSPAQGIGNGGKSVIKGIELDSSVSPFEGFSINASYAYLDTKLKSIAIPALEYGFALFTPNGVAGGDLALTPKHKYNLGASYTLPLDESIGSITFSALYSYQSPTNGNRSSVSLFRLPKQKNLNLNLNWKDVGGLPLDASLFVTNLTKERYVVYAAGASFGWDSASLNEPRMFGGRLRYRFGS